MITHNTHNRQTSILPAGFEPAIPASERLQTHALDRAAAGIGVFQKCVTHIVCWHSGTLENSLLFRTSNLHSPNFQQYFNRFACTKPSNTALTVCITCFHIRNASFYPHGIFMLRIIIWIITYYFPYRNNKSYLKYRCDAFSVMYGLDDPGFDPRLRQDIFLFFETSRSNLGPTQPPNRYVSGTISPRVKRPGYEDNQPPPSIADVKNECSYKSTLLMCLPGANRDNFTFCTWYAF
jgi:hypothetical protein